LLLSGPTGKRDIFYGSCKSCRHRKKHDADRYCAQNALLLSGPTGKRDIFYGSIALQVRDKGLGY